MQTTIAATLAFMITASAYAASPGNAPQLPITDTRIVNVSTEAQLQAAMGNLQNGDTILIADGTYNLTSTLYINGKNNITIRGTSGCDGVKLVGKGQDNPNFGNVQLGIWSNGVNTTIAHLTLRDTYDNLIIFNPGAQSPHLYCLKLLNSGSQFIKSNPTDGPNGVGVDNAVVEYCWMEYLGGPPATDHGAGAGYTNGISAHSADNWIIRGNLFKNFHTPDSSPYAWNPAVLMWNHSSNTLTEQNTFVNVDRAIAYGLSDVTGFDHSGGTIRNNFVYYQPGLMSSARKAGSDGAIIAWDCNNAKIYHNTVMSNGNVSFAIEFRFASSTGGEARNNLSDVPIHLRDGATASQSGNLGSATSAMFVDMAAADLHLLATATAAINTAPTLAAVTNDFDGNTRPQGSEYDIGADEYVPAGGDTTAPSVPAGLTATAVSSSAINLSWSASTDNVAVTGYKIFRNGTQIATTAGTTYQNSGLTAATAYTYRVAAYDAVGNTSAQSTSASATTQSGGGGGTPPNQPPTISSAAAATPNPARVGQSVAFNVAGADADGDTLAYAWSFGDGSSGSGASVTHVYAAKGAYTVRVTITDGKGGTAIGTLLLTVNKGGRVFGTGLDTDDDGFSDALEALVGTDANDAASTPLDGASAGTPLSLTISSMSVKLNFAKGGGDSIAFSGTLEIPAGYSAANKMAVIMVGGVLKAITLDAKGHSPRGDNTFKIAIKATKGAVAAQIAKYTVKLNRGTFAAGLGLQNADAENASASLQVDLMFAGSIFEATQALTYSAKAGKGGRAKSAK